MTHSVCTAHYTLCFYYAAATLPHDVALPTPTRDMRHLREISKFSINRWLRKDPGKTVYFGEPPRFEPGTWYHSVPKSKERSD